MIPVKPPTALGTHVTSYFFFVRFGRCKFGALFSHAHPITKMVTLSEEIKDMKVEVLSLKEEMKELEEIVKEFRKEIQEISKHTNIKGRDCAE